MPPKPTNAPKATDLHVQEVRLIAQFLVVEHLSFYTNFPFGQIVLVSQKKQPKFTLLIMFDVNTLENIPTMPDKKEHNESSNSSAASDESKDPVSREQELKRKLAATRNMQMLAAHEELDELHDDTIDAFNMMPHALNTEMFDSDIFGDLDDL